MKLSKLEKAPHYEVVEWLNNELQLSPYQKEKLRDNEVIRFAPFEFYKQRQKEKVSPLWRLTIFLIPAYIIALYIICFLSFILTGIWGLDSKFLNKFHYPWMNKLKL